MERFKVRRRGGLLIAVSVMWLAGCNSQGRLEELASRGEIQADAPVKASLETTIRATPERVFALLVDVKGWPNWHAPISDVELSSPVGRGTEFSWKMVETKIHSRMALVDPPNTLAWTGTALGTHAVHVWKLERLPDGTTKVRVEESMDGLLLGAFYSSKKLAESDQEWLDDLKLAAELRQ